MTASRNPLKTSRGRAGVAGLAALSSVAGIAAPALADQPVDVPNGIGEGYKVSTADDPTGHWLGAFANPDGSSVPAWCIELGPTAPSVGNGGDTSEITGNARGNGQDASLTANAAQMAYILNKYQDQGDAESRAALSLLAHANFDITGSGKVGILISTTQQTHPSVVALAQKYVAEAKTSTVVDYGTPTVTGDGKLSGTVDGIGAKTASGAWASGKNVTVTLDGPAVFDTTGKNTWSGTTSDAATSLKWHSTGTGDVKVTVTYNDIAPSSLTQYSNGADIQDMATIGAKPTDVSKTATFKTILDFQPKVVSSTEKAGSRTVKAGATTISDSITVSADETYANPSWTEVDGKPVPVVLTGTAYYTGDLPADESKTVPEGAEVVGTADVTANGPGEYKASIDVKDGVKSQYITWVWSIQKDKQGDNAQYVHEDYSDGYGNPDEYTSGQTPVSVDSTAQSNVTKSGTYLVDNLYISGFDDDHGTFKGGAGFDADVATMTQSLYFFPADLKVTDANLSKAQKIASVDVPAKNTYGDRIGSDKFKMIDDETPGTYVFVTSFAGDSRTQAFTSSVTDTHEQITVTPTPVEIHTTATDKADGDKTVNPATGDVTISDKVCQVSGKGLKAGKTYTLTATAMDKSTGKAIVGDDGKPITGTAEFTPKSDKDCGVVDVKIPASKLTSTTKVVMFENVAYEGKTVAVHTDINDKGQTVDVKHEVGTTLTDKSDGDHEVEAGKVTLEDSVCPKEGTKFEAGKTYTVTGELMDKATGKEVLGADGKPVTGTTDFKPTKDTDCAVVPFEFDTSELAGHDVVAFETVYQPGSKTDVFAEHKDINDKGQTVHVKEKPGTPALGTTLTDKSDGDHEVGIGTVTLNDKVCPKNDTTFEAGKSYTVTGTLMDKATGKALADGKGNEVTSTVTFTPKSTSDCAIVPFTFNTTNLGGHDVVAFETAYKAGSKTDVLAVHKDINDKNQTVHVTGPSQPVQSTTTTTTAPRTSSSTPSFTPAQSTGSFAHTGAGLGLLGFAGLGGGLGALRRRRNRK